MQVTYRIPSRKVQYGYLEFTVDEGQALPDPVELAEQYVQYIKDYQAAEVQAFENPAARQIKKADATEDINEVAAAEIKSQLGATIVSEANSLASASSAKTNVATDVTNGAPPWAKAATESKEWEEPQTAAPKAAPTDSSDWDF